MDASVDRAVGVDAPPAPDRLAALAAHQAAFAATVEHADPEIPVPWCGRWRVRSLVVHLARVHHWAAGQARRRQETPLGRGPFDLPELYGRCAAELRQTLAGLDPDARAWTLLDDGVPRAEQRGTVAFWHRRQALETLVHLWDLRTAVGEPLDVGVEHWLDCVDEVVSVMHPRQLRLERVAPPGARVRLLATDGGPTSGWTLAGASSTGPAVAVRGPARTLALLVWGRTGPDDEALEVVGDRAALVRVLAGGLTP